MKNKVFIMGLILLGIISVVFGSTESLTCSIRDNSCIGDEVPLFYANQHFTDSSGNILSSNVATIPDLNNYNKALCCESNMGEKELSVSYSSSTTCSGANNFSLIHFTNYTNSRIGFDSDDIEGDEPDSYDFDASHYLSTLCLKIPDEFATIELKVSEDELDQYGYTCMFRTSNLTNGVVSACESFFNTNDQYPYTIWGKLSENEATITCNSDCTSKLDNRVYSMCGEHIQGCELVPEECDGSLLGSWVSFNDTNEIKCSPDWNEFRTPTFSSTKIDITSDSQDCDNIISKSYPVILDNEVVNMRFYVCNN